MKHLIVIVGPTAIGKTALSIRLAQVFGAEILSCDSRQFFKEMNIGTAAPTSDEQAAAPHHFVQQLSIHEQYTVGDYEKQAVALLDQLYQKNDVAIMVGGSGLYVDAVLKGFDTFPEIASEVRQTVQQQYQEKGLAYLQEQLKVLDLKYYEKISAKNPQTLLNPQRMMRFVEVCLGTQKPYSSFLNQKQTQRNFTPIIIGLEAERSVLYDRINHRVDLMIGQGLLDEAKSLYPYKDLNALQTVGYRELFAYFDGQESLEKAVENIKTNTRHFAKRQLTWFRRTPNVVWFDYTTDAEKIVALIQQKIKENAHSA
ncbi:tRNA (adenosine(37)-N6)-dimethylallyltransferase MiaA [Flavobacterium sp. CYK-55]|uniref:tRNA (adenosine(37)-N6)-dimethylallyltransferase MiaA n=1 Tax=Flavobacterium sp. CYK-55 TaxID=2835529 RepID=UPI001BD06E6B|nr:tRNA (adenosine(37)-N6)-dimethylallyltransferase MiaA [Flavobacterium sp. CYK-55]MBS7786739.1 tRNA (adenosine(37)-N6)-dimethylallyltransferase MiaA [Flavobacterium sp. CYK-55]